MPKAPQEIKRYPFIKNDPLQGWDAADELILAHINTLPLKGKRILILNDDFGALSCGLHDGEITTYTDSFVSSQGIIKNSEGKIIPINDLKKLEGFYDYVLIKIPKNLSFFEDTLCHLTHHLKQGSQIICGSMVKHLSSGSFDLLNKYIGTTTTSLAQKKARLVFASFDKSPVSSPYPLEVVMDGFQKTFTNFSNLFSREKLDIGTRFFLEHLPQNIQGKILDLGCANGIVGIKARMQSPLASIVFSDDSAMAIESAKVNYQKYFDDQPHLLWTNCYEGGEKNSLDLVLCNPPFHQQNTIGDFIAWQMFKDSFEALKQGGCLRIVGNSHLGYQVKLKKIFGNSQIIATNAKFMICQAIKN
jgi:23S rRNA (guanine1835-N2)-methyltransferase